MNRSLSGPRYRLGYIALAATLLGVVGSACGGNSGDSASGGSGPSGGTAGAGGNASGGSAEASGGGTATGGRAAGGGSPSGGVSAGGGNGAGGFQFPGNSEDCPTDAPEDGSVCTIPEDSESGGGSGFPGAGGLFCLYDANFCTCSAESSTWNCFGGGDGQGGEGPGPGFGGESN